MDEYENSWYATSLYITIGFFPAMYRSNAAWALVVSLVLDNVNAFVFRYHERFVLSSASPAMFVKLTVFPWLL